MVLLPFCGVVNLICGVVRDENKWLILEGRGRMKVPTLSEKSFIRPVNLLYLPN